MVKILASSLWALVLSGAVYAQGTIANYTPPQGIKVEADIQYGSAEKQSMDIYYPQNATNAPVIFMIHGGAWRGGDKGNKGEFVNKVNHWVTSGFIFISTNYRHLPEVKPMEQTDDLIAALGFAQKNAKRWGGSAEKFILMGHSSGAHLVSLISANFESVRDKAIKPWLGTVSLDISGYDLIKKVKGPNPSEFYKDIFGENIDYLKKASPFHALKGKIPPFMAVCAKSSVDACIQAKHFTEKAGQLGAETSVLAVDLSHMEINHELGKTTCYTQKVDEFLISLNADIASLLGRSTNPKPSGCRNI